MHRACCHLRYVSFPFFRRSGGGSLWSGLKQMFHNKSPAPQDSNNTEKRRRLEQSSFSYSCLGNAKTQKHEEDIYVGPGPQGSLSKNISYSHESVFQMDSPHIQLVSSNL